MAKIDIYGIIEKHGLDKEEVSKQLFPESKKPYFIMRRIHLGEQFLDSNQLHKLASLAGVSVDALYDQSDWKTKHSGDKHTFECGEYKAELDRKTWITKIFHKGSLFHDEVITPGTTSLSVYLNELDRIISDHKLE